MQNLKIAAAHIRTRRNGQDIENLNSKPLEYSAKKQTEKKKKGKRKNRNNNNKKMKATFGDGKLVLSAIYPKTKPKVLLREKEKEK